MELKLFRKKTEQEKANIVFENTICREYGFKRPYRLSYRELRIIGWIAMVFTIMATLFSAFSKMKSTGVLDSYYVASMILGIFSDLAMPCFLVANFSLIIRGSNKFSKLFLKFGGLCLLMLLLNYGFIHRYVIELLFKSNGFETSVKTLTEMLNAIPNVATALNAFIDLFLCVAFLFFITYNPKKYFKGKKIYIFRAFSVLPIIYEFLSLSIRITTVVDSTTLIPSWVFPLLCTKPPFLFLSFVALTLYLKFRKKKIIKKGFTHEEYEEFLGSKEDVIDFNHTLSLIFLVAILVDLFAYMTSLTFIGLMSSSNEAFNLEYTAAKLYKIGIGDSTGLLLMIPILRFYSYKKEVKPTIWEPFIPLIGIALYLLAAVEIIVDSISR